MEPGLEARWKPFDNPEVERVFERYPEETRAKLMELRQLIFDAAAATTGVGELEETLRWGEPSYLTTQSKSGSMIRLDSKQPGRYALYFHCQTDLVARFRKLYPNELDYEGNRAVTFDERRELPDGELRHCIAMALTYHLDKRKRVPAARKP